mmetsp:Transcript_38092/g.77715  ORF Transcript_38092/g.77715 Transcript_38092/m.77715 type:complete len:342 (-) Transcript_38092:339-1364(-)|eukprot:CAMPEP_0183300524 /NCGR_PEP_ID=MMETSP0160_2-20130417/6928_1 /TAXON_ID=2839 ORGANISM="Odontella Sinensis, Strain Grunow 1884" /NCGR_SAMPLE_ID=MMETSP0160_2 /ASSEMBLY_ACC=CAM_ASM_000250 /LENGTH=341 /DNA_ID=CAMNT_0025462963 /DNA_START=76 /DNA_END=1101 /DNA_ORIENTATION=-
MNRAFSAIAVALIAVSALPSSEAFVRTNNPRADLPPSTAGPSSRVVRFSTPGPDLEEKFGGYTVKQRLREEVESPFRTVRLVFFGSSTGSALTALYFSSLSTVKAAAGTYADAPSLEEALTNCAINLGAAVLCAFLTYRDWKAGEANLERIARGGQLAKLVVNPAFEDNSMKALGDYRRAARVVIAAGGKDYVETMCRSLCSDQRADVNTLSEALENSDLVVVPVLLEGNGNKVGDVKLVWRDVKPLEGDRNFDSTRSDRVVAFPKGNNQWAEYLENEISTASGQGFNVLEKGITITVKKNGRILRRATGLPQWENLVGTMEVLDGSKFGMPGDSEKYGGP